MTRYVAFDVETPNRRNDRISSIGITVIEDGHIVDSYASLVNPETHFDPFNVALTGISPSMVRDAVTFPQLWQIIQPVMSDGLLVAHNAPFDLGVLKKCLFDYNVEWKPYVRYLCTVQMGRRLMPDIKHNLNVMCDHFGISLDHHRADSDSRACALILLRYIQDGAQVRDFIRTFSFNK